MNRFKEWLSMTFIGAGAAILALITIAVSVTLVPLISLLIGLWIGFVTQWLAGDLLLVDNLPALMATIFFLVSSITMLIKVNVKDAKM